MIERPPGAISVLSFVGAGSICRARVGAASLAPTTRWRWVERRRGGGGGGEVPAACAGGVRALAGHGAVAGGDGGRSPATRRHARALPAAKRGKGGASVLSDTAPPKTENKNIN